MPERDNDIEIGNNTFFFLLPSSCGINNITAVSISYGVRLMSHTHKQQRPHLHSLDISLPKLLMNINTSNFIFFKSSLDYKERVT